MLKHFLSEKPHLLKSLNFKWCLLIAFLCFLFFVVGGLSGSREFLLYDQNVTNKVDNFTSLTSQYVQKQQMAWRISKLINETASETIKTECIKDSSCLADKSKKIQELKGQLSVYQEDLANLERELLLKIEEINKAIKPKNKSSN